MSTVNELEIAHRAALKAFQKLSPAQKMTRLQEFGILGADGQLAVRYGGKAAGRKNGSRQSSAAKSKK